MSEEKPGTPKSDAPESPAPPDSGASSGPATPSSGTSAAGSSAGAEMTREEKIAAARAKAEALKAQRAAASGAPAAPGGPATAQPTSTAPGGAAAAPGAAAAKPAPPKPELATSENPGGQPAVAPQNPAIKALGTITQSVELTCAATEDPNIRKILGGLGAYKNPLRGVWQLDYRYYAEALKRLQAAGYKVEGADYLGRPLDKWTPETRGWTRLS